MKFNFKRQTEKKPVVIKAATFKTKETALPITPVFKAPTKKLSVGEQLAKNRENKKTKKPEDKPKAKRSVIFGSGLTKKTFAKQATAGKSDKSFKASLERNRIAREKQAATVGEQAIAAAEKEIEAAPVPIPIVDLEIPPTDKIVLDEYQERALQGLKSEQFGVLIGAAGTGKTTVTKQLCEVLEHWAPTIDINAARATRKTEQPEFNVAIAFASFTGRAVQQMKRALPKHYHPMCSTVHSLLGYAPVFETRVQEDGSYKDVKIFRPSFGSWNKLPYKIIIIDEAGMLGTHLANELFDAMTDDCRLFFIGDINQLPPPFGKSILGFAMINWPTFALEKIHRQAEGNPIIANAHRILQGQFPRNDPEHFITIQSTEGSLGTYKKVNDAVKYLNSIKQFDPFRDALIVPQNVGTLGQTHINEDLMHYFNAEKKVDGLVINPRETIKAGNYYYHFAKGDKVMLLANDKDRGLTNGMIGKVINVNLNGNFNEARGFTTNAEPMEGDFDLDQLAANHKTEVADRIEKEKTGSKEKEEEAQRQASHVMTVSFYVHHPDGTVEEEEVEFSTAGAFRKIAIAYAFTCHKAQGAEFPIVVICLHSANARMLCREWFYTAVTRAQERVVLIYNNRGLALALKNQRITGKTIKEKAEQFLALSETLPGDELPNLPEARKVEE